MDKTPEEIVDEIQFLCSLLGWDVAINDAETGVKGLIIGQLDFVQHIVMQLEEYDAYEIYRKPEVFDPNIH